MDSPLFGQFTLCVLDRELGRDGSVTLLVAATTDGGALEGIIRVLPEPAEGNSGDNAPDLFAEREGSRLLCRLSVGETLLADLRGHNPPRHLRLSILPDPEDLNATSLRHDLVRACGDYMDRTQARIPVALSSAPNVSPTPMATLPRRYFASALMTLRDVHKTLSKKEDIRVIERVVGELVMQAFDDLQSDRLQKPYMVDDDVSWAHHAFAERLDVISEFLAGFFTASGSLWRPLPVRIADTSAKRGAGYIDDNERVMRNRIDEHRLLDASRLFCHHAWLQSGYWAGQLTGAFLFTLAIDAQLAGRNNAAQASRYLDDDWKHLAFRLGVVAATVILLVAGKPLWAIAFLLLVIANRVRPGPAEAMSLLMHRAIAEEDFTWRMINLYESWLDEDVVFGHTPAPPDPQVLYDQCMQMTPHSLARMPLAMMSLLRFCSGKGIPLSLSLEREWRALSSGGQDALLADYFGIGEIDAAPDHIREAIS